MNKVHKIDFIALLLVCPLITLADASSYLAEKPDFLTPCSLEESSFNKCLAKNLQAIFVQWKDGIPGTKTVGPIDPFFVKRVKFSQDASQAIAVNAELKNIYIAGGSQMTVREASYNPNKHVAKAVAFVPKLRFDFDYKLKGQLLALPLDGHGKGYFETEDAVIGLDLAVKPRIAPEGNFADVQRVRITFREIGKFHIKLNGLFGSNAELERTAHDLFNENWRQFYEILRPTVEQTFEAILLDRTKKIFTYVPATYFVENFQ